jgi:hypothetical protein
VSTALAPPFLLAALLLCVAGALKLRSPHVAADALRVLGLPGSAWMVRILAAGEFVIGAGCAVYPTRATGAVLAGAYAAFAGVAVVLVRRRASGCGCFGETETPVSAVHWITSLIFAAVALAAIVAGSSTEGGHGRALGLGLGWVLSRSAPTALVLLVGIAGSLYATVLVYTQLPAAWTAWGGK